MFDICTDTRKWNWRINRKVKNKTREISTNHNENNWKTLGKHEIEKYSPVLLAKYKINDRKEANWQVQKTIESSKRNV